MYVTFTQFNASFFFQNKAEQNNKHNKTIALGTSVYSMLVYI